MIKDNGDSDQYLYDLIHALVCSETSKTRPKPPQTSPSSGGGLQAGGIGGSGVSPSPVSLRRGGGAASSSQGQGPPSTTTLPSHQQNSSQSAPNQMSPIPVDLTAESSSVSSPRKVQNTGKFLRYPHLSNQPFDLKQNGTQLIILFFCV